MQMGVQVLHGHWRWLARKSALLAFRRQVRGLCATAPLQVCQATCQLRRWISGCSGDDFLRWQEQEKMLADAAVPSNAMHEDSVKRVLVQPGLPSASRDEAAGTPTSALRDETQQGTDSGDLIPHAFTRNPASSSTYKMPESLARHMKQATARWKLRQVQRRQLGTPKAPPGAEQRAPATALDACTGDRNLGGWRKDFREIAPHLPEQQWRSLAEKTYRAGVSVSADGHGQADLLRKKLRYACSKRGWVEMEILLARFVQATGDLNEFNEGQLCELERVLLADDLFLMAMITQRKPVPTEFQDFHALRRLLEIARKA